MFETSAPALWSKKKVYALLVGRTIATMLTSHLERSQATCLRDKCILNLTWYADVN
jgi:hypothetical protein